VLIFAVKKWKREEKGATNGQSQESAPAAVWESNVVGGPSGKRRGGGKMKLSTDVGIFEGQIIKE